jgi:hypothetical protein
MIKKIFLLLIIIPQIVLSTAQVPDYLIYKGEVHELNVNPLEIYFEEHQEIRPKSDILWSNNWRSYIAKFEIVNNELMIKEITVNRLLPENKHKVPNFETKRVSVLETIFPSANERKMNWFSGILVIPKGERTTYIHHSYASMYESYLLLRIQNGILMDKAQMDYKEFLNYKNRQFEQYIKTNEFNDLMLEYKSSNPDSTYDENKISIFQYGDFIQKIYIPFN